jgi:hypothetical protein
MLVPLYLEIFMQTSSRLTLSFLTVAVLAACGGGDGTTAAGTPAPAGAPAPAPAPAAAVPSPTATPTATLAGTQADGQTAIDEVKAGLSGAQGAANGVGVRAPFKPSQGAEKTSDSDLLAVSQTINCNIITGGSGSITYDIPTTTTIATGYTITYTYNNCSFGYGTYNGTYRLVYDNYVSATDYTFTSSYTNFTLSGVPGQTGSQSISGSTTCTVRASATSCYYSDGSRNWSSSVTYSNGVVNGSYAGNYGSGSVRVTYTNFGATSGTAVVEGSNGRYTIRRCGADAFTITWAPTSGTGGTYNYGGGCA